MISAVAKIGRLIKEIEKHGKINIIYSETNKSTEQGYIFAIVVDSDEDYQFKELSVEQFDPEKISRYLYKEGESKGNRPAPIAPLTEPEKTFEKILRWLEKCAKLSELEEEERKIPEKMVKNLKEKEKLILSELDSKLKEVPKKAGKYLTVKIGNSYIGDIELFRKAHLKITLEKIKKSSAENKTCSICGEVKENVSARTYVYNFDTDDKPGFITWFDKNNFWKNFPVCQECRELLKKGREFIDSQLTFNFCGFRYQVIPNILKDDAEVFNEIVDILSHTRKDISLKDKTIKRITSDEKEILPYLSQKEDNVTFNLLFLETQQSAERIVLLIEDVYPSRLKKIFKAKKQVDNLFTKADFKFDTLRLFFKKSDTQKKNFDLDKYFLEIVDSVFKGRKINFKFIVKFFMQNIREQLVQDKNYLDRTRDAFICVKFFEELGILDFQEVTMETGIFEQIFEKYGKSLNTPEKRAIFLLGALTQMLLNKQRFERSGKHTSPPFMKKLKSLKMDEKDIKALLPEVVNKLIEYDAFDTGKKIIAQEASRYFLEAGDNWKMHTDELNFYFACGMNMSDEIKNIVYTEGKEGEQNEQK
ncbi:MAG: TIGR02556 family CRISPR-associated protein [bacterium]|nr:TIGR02556 family CRISPR-associated protein [bacterium]